MTALLALLALAPQSTGRTAPMTEEVLLAGFDSEAEVAQMTVRDRTHLELITDDTKQGPRAARITFENVLANSEQWPAVIWRAEGQTITDFSPYASLSFWAKNVGEASVPLWLVIYDAAGGRGAPQPSRLELQPGRWTHVVADMPTGGADLSHVESLHFFQDRNQETRTVIIDDVRLIPAFVADANHVRRAVEQAQDEAAEAGFGGRITTRLQALSDELRDLLDRAAQTDAGSPEAGGIRRAASALARDADDLSLLCAKGRAAKIAGAEDEAYVLVAESSMVKVMPDRAPFGGRPGQPLRIAAARGEVEGGQVIVAPLSLKLRDVTFTISDLVGPGGRRLPPESVELAPVGYVYTNPEAPPSYPVDRFGWFPDPVLPFLKSFDVPRNRVQSLWLNITVPRDQAPGSYRGKITVTPTNAEPRTLPVRLRVLDFEVPRKRSLKTAICTFEHQLPRVHGEQWNQEMYWRYVDFLHAHRINMDRIYRGHSDPPTLEDVRRLVAGGQDAWCLRYIVQPGAGGSGAGVDPDKFDEYVSQAIDDCRKAYGVFRQAGAEGICYVYFFDEVGPQHYGTLKQAAARVREALPGVPLLTTARDPDYGITSGVSDAIDAWVPLTPAFNAEEGRDAIRRARQNGDEVWWYICIGPRRPYANMFIEYDAIEARLLMGAMTQKYKPDGFLYYATTMWGPNDQPIAEGPYTDWDPASYKINNGDGSWFCAGPDGPLTTIRFENFRDGLEDYEYYCLLEKAIADARARGVPEARLAGAESLLTVPPQIVTSLTEFTRLPRLIERHRLEVAEAIERLR